MPALAGQNVVGSAGRLGVHGFDTQTQLDQALQAMGRWELQPPPTAKNQQLHPHLAHRLKMVWTQVIRVLARPVQSGPFGADDHAVVHFFPVDGDPSFTLAGHGQDIHLIGLKFHGG